MVNSSVVDDIRRDEVDEVRPNLVFPDGVKAKAEPKVTGPESKSAKVKTTMFFVVNTYVKIESGSTFMMKDVFEVASLLLFGCCSMLHWQKNDTEFSNFTRHCTACLLPTVEDRVVR